MNWCVNSPSCQANALKYCKSSPSGASTLSQFASSDDVLTHQSSLDLAQHECGQRAAVDVGAGRINETENDRLVIIERM